MLKECQSYSHHNSRYLYKNIEKFTEERFGKKDFIISLKNSQEPQIKPCFFLILPLSKKWTKIVK